LHERDGFVCPFDIICEVGADFWGDELLVVGFRRDRGIELVDYVVAEGAVQVEVELDFGPGGDGGLAVRGLAPADGRSGGLAPAVGCGGQLPAAGL